ncbi:peroxidase family protein [Jiella endophytica]|nr:heme peroxidase family protein [Jiella endophytica]
MPHGGTFENHVVAPRSKFYQGPFGRICSDLEPWFPPSVDPKKPNDLDDHLLAIAEKMLEADSVTPEEIAQDSGRIRDLENVFSSTTPAGYTYFGQFVDHDITFDPASSLMRENDPAGLLNHRTPRLDLDNVYGRGPDDSPYLYDRDDVVRDASGKEIVDKFLIGEIIEQRSGTPTPTGLPDLPRNGQGRALIGDMRNDENAMVSQLQLAFLKAHNALADRARAFGAANSFEAARKTLRWLYQWIVWHDFLARILRDDVRQEALKKESFGPSGQSLELGLKHVYSWKEMPFMPVEFAVAAYRYGHSMVRNSYQTNEPFRGFGNFAPIFDRSGDPADRDSRKDLSGFRAMQRTNIIQWDWFLPTQSSSGPFPQMARKIDSRMANALAFLRESGRNMNILAFRNLLRGVRFELPSGTSVARKFCIDPIDIDPSEDALWFYILKEAEIRERGEKLGPLGSTIVAAVFAGLLKGDPSSWVNSQPCWTPADDPLLEDGEDNKDSPGKWQLSSIIRIGGSPVSSADVEKLGSS